MQKAAELTSLWLVKPLCPRLSGACPILCPWVPGLERRPGCCRREEGWFWDEVWLAGLNTTVQEPRASGLGQASSVAFGPGNIFSGVS